MNRRNWLWAVLVAATVAVGGLADAKTLQAKGYTCPVTGEELPCEKCCPLNDAPAATEAKPAEPKAAPAEYICPLTGEKLGCPNCCPLNKAKK